MAARYPNHAYDEAARPAGVVYVLMLVVALAFGGFVWQLFSPPPLPRIEPASASYKMAPPSPSSTLDPEEESAALASPGESGTNELTAAVAESDLGDQVGAVAGAPRLGADPRFTDNGPYVAQLAALQSQAAVDPAWRRLASRAPDLFRGAQLDVERADLGARGVYYRVRAGYFADRANAVLFCERLRRMGQDCIVASR